MSHQNYFVYFLTNQRHTVLYIGITNDLLNRVAAHGDGLGSYFTRQYQAKKLVYFEAYPEPTPAIAREEQLKAWSRKKKVTLIAKANPEWRDLMVEMFPVKNASQNGERRDIRDGGSTPLEQDPSTALRCARDDGKMGGIINE